MRFAVPVVVISVALGPSLAHAHNTLTDPPARPGPSTTESPCSGIARTDAPTDLYAGDTIQVSWYVTVPHGGKFRVAFSPGNDQGFDQTVLADDIPDEEGVPSVYTDVTLPSCTCDACTIQVEQLTEGGLAGYYSCADIRLIGEDIEPCELISGDTGTSDGSGDASGDGSSGGSGDASASTTAGTSGATTSDSGADSTAGEGTGSTQDADESGCSCRANGSPVPWLLALVPVLALMRRRTNHCEGGLP